MVLLCCGVNRLIVRLSSSQMRKTLSVYLTSLGRVSFLRVFFFSLFLKKKTSVALLCSVVGGGGFSSSWGLQYPRNLFITQGPHLTSNKLWTCPDTEPLGLVPGCQRCYLLGPFEEEGEGIGIASDAVKVKGEDLATLGYYLRSVDTSKSRDRNETPISVYKTKQNSNPSKMLTVTLSPPLSLLYT